MTAILELRKVNAAYASTQILRAVDLIVEERGITTLLGANGAGKTTTLRAICNMMVRVSGEIWFAGERIDGKATEDIARLGVAHVPDGRGTFLDLTVEENLRIGAYTRRDKGLLRISTGSTAISRASRSVGGNRPGLYPAASSRCWRSRAL